jgi:hypothetical protein
VFAAGTVAYRERLYAPWWLWLAALGLAALLLAEVFLGTAGTLLLLAYAVALPATAAGLWYAGRLPVRVTTTEFQVDDARLPIGVISQVGVLNPTAKREALSTAADPDAFIVQRPWIPRAVLVVLDDPTDPTPYWVVSSRHPEQVATALLAAREAAAGASRRDVAAEAGRDRTG